MRYVAEALWKLLELDRVIRAQMKPRCADLDYEQWIRYIVCHNPLVAEEQKKRRERNLRELESQLNSLKQRANAWKRPSIKTVVKEAEEVLSHKHGLRLLDYKVDERSRKLDYYRKQEGMEIEEALDGLYILRTKQEELTPLRIIHAYKGLCDVERAFRTMKSVLDLRPFYHHLEPRVRAHAFICFLATENSESPGD